MLKKAACWKLLRLVFCRIQWKCALFAALWVGAAVEPGWGQLERREAVSVQTSAQAQQKLADAEQLLKEEQWSSAIDSLRRVLEQQPNVLVKAAPGRYVTAGYYAKALLARMPLQGLNVFRRLTDTQAKRWLARGIQERNAELLQQVADRFFVSSSGDDALWQLGQWAWELGRFDDAQAYWRRLLPVPKNWPDERVGPLARFPDARFDAAEVRARLILATAFSGQLEQARRRLALFRKLHGAAQGTLGGRHGLWVDLLSDVLKQLEREQAGSLSTNPLSTNFLSTNGQSTRSLPTISSSTDSLSTVSKSATSSRRMSLLAEGNASTEWLTFGGNVQRNGRAGAVAEIGRVLWKRRLPALAYGVLPYGVAGESTRLPVLYPVVWNGAVFFNDAFSVYGFNLHTGRPVWRLSGVDGCFYRAPWAQAALPVQPVQGLGKYTATVTDNGRLYTKLGPPVTFQAADEFRARSELAGFDLLGGEGRLCWRATADQFIPPTAGWSFAGSPLVLGRRLYVAVAKGSPNPAAYLACYDLSRRKAVWLTRVCTSLRTANPRWNQAGHVLLSAGQGLLFYLTDLGAVAAVDQSDGHVEWVVTYSPDSPNQQQPRSPETADGLAPCLYDNGLVCAAPPNFPGVLLIDADSGVLLYEVPLPEPARYLLGLVGDVLVASGQGLYGINVRTGRVCWTLRFSDPAGHSIGRGLVAGDRVYWPTWEELFVVAPRTGRIVRRINLLHRYGLHGGNLAVVKHKLILTTAEWLTVFDQFGQAD